MYFYYNNWKNPINEKQKARIILNFLAVKKAFAMQNMKWTEPVGFKDNPHAGADHFKGSNPTIQADLKRCQIATKIVFPGAYRWQPLKVWTINTSSQHWDRNSSGYDGFHEFHENSSFRHVLFHEKLIFLYQISENEFVKK